MTRLTEFQIVQQIEQIKQTLQDLDRESENLLPVTRQKEISQQQRTLNESWDRLNSLHYSLYGNW